MLDFIWRNRVRKEIGLWCEHVLDRPSKFFNGLAPCPYAKSAWNTGKAKLVFGNASDVNRIMTCWDDKHDLVILVIKNEKEFDRVAWTCKVQNTRHADSDLYAMDFVPGEGIDSGQPDDEMMDWPHVIEKDYAMVFVQRISELHKASASLERKGYYTNCSPEFRNYVHERNDKHARQEEDYEEKGYGHEEERQQEDACRAG